MENSLPPKFYHHSFSRLKTHLLQTSTLILFLPPGVTQNPLPHPSLRLEVLVSPLQSRDHHTHLRGFKKIKCHLLHPSHFTHSKCSTNVDCPLLLSFSESSHVPRPRVGLSSGETSSPSSKCFLFALTWFFSFFFCQCYLYMMAPGTKYESFLHSSNMLFFNKYFLSSYYVSIRK